MILTAEEQQDVDNLIPAARRIYFYVRENWGATHEEALDELGFQAQWYEIPGQESTPLGDGRPAYPGLRRLFGRSG